MICCQNVNVIFLIFALYLLYCIFLWVQINVLFLFSYLWTYNHISCQHNMVEGKNSHPDCTKYDILSKINWNTYWSNLLSILHFFLFEIILFYLPSLVILLCCTHNRPVCYTSYPSLCPFCVFLCFCVIMCPNYVLICT